MKPKAIIAIIAFWGLEMFDIAAQENLKYKLFWESNFTKACDSAQHTNKNVLLLFSGSDWCKPCIKLWTQILETDTFINYSLKHFILINADFPYHKKLSKDVQIQNEKLAEQYNSQGAFPKLLILNSKGEVLFQKGYVDCSPAEYIRDIDQKIFNK